jgi:hypothetical protein
VARAIATELGFRVVDEEIVKLAAAEAGVNQEVIEDVERRKTALAKIIGRISGGPETNADLLMSAGHPVTAATLGVAPTGIRRTPSDGLRGLIRSAIDSVAARGDVVIVAHAAAHALAGREGVLRVLVTASEPTRITRVGERLQLDSKDAQNAVRKSDEDRADYLKRFYKIDEELPVHYDLTINTDTLAPEAAAASIVALVTRSSAPAN